MAQMGKALRSMGAALPGSQFSRGVATLVTGTAIAQLIVALTAPILTRLYDPSAVGVFAVASSMVSILIAVTCLRYEFAIPLPEADTAAANVLALSILTNLVMSVLVGAVLWLIGPWLLALFGASVLAPYVLLIALGQMGGGLMSAFTSWAVRTRSFSGIAATRVVQSVVVVVSQVAFGIIGLGAPGLLVGDVGGRLAGSLQLATAAWRGHTSALRGVSWAGITLAARRYRRFPIFSSGSALLNALGMEIPLLLLVALFGAHVGGEYAIAQRVVALPVTLLATAVGQVYVAEAARLARDDPNALRGLFGTTTRRLGLLAIVPGVILALAAPLLAELVFGPAWAEVGIFVTILVPMYYLQLLTSPTGGTLDVLERQDLHLAREILRIVSLVAVVLVAAELHLSAVATIVVLSVTGCVFYIVYGLVSWRALVLHETSQLAAAVSAIGATGIGSETRLGWPDAGVIEEAPGTAVRTRADTPVAVAGPPALADGGRAQPATSASAGRPITLSIHVPTTYPAQRRYVFDVVLREWLGLEYELAFEDRADVSIRLRDDPNGKQIVIAEGLFATSREDWLTERSMPRQPLLRAPDPFGRGPSKGDSDGNGPSSSLPIIFGSVDETNGVWTRTPNGIALAIDVFGSVFFMLTRYEEVVRLGRDRHDRFTAMASLAADEGFLDRPIADEYVDVLWAAIRDVWPEATRRPSVFRLRLTHDVDEPWATYGRSLSTVARGVAGDVIRRRDPALASRRAVSLISARSGRVDRDPYNTFDFLMDTSERYGLKSSFYFLAGNTAGEIDGSYELSDPKISRLLTRIHERGHEVGLHTSYGTHQSAELTRVEFEALKATCQALGFDQPTWGVRQHFLRLEIPQTWRNHDAAGLDHDSTLGFADLPGFRAGTCREYPLFDLLRDRPMALRERPLVVMDTTLFSYLRLDLADAASRTRSIVDACRRHQGDAVLCFHNSRLTGSSHRSFYEGLIQDLVRG
jgi:O-antigen/teichoic acid export membrane protein